MYHNIMGVKIEYEICYILYTGKDSPVIFSPSLSGANLILGQFQCLKFSLFINTTMAGRICNGAKLFASVDRRKLHRAKITMLQYTMI